MKHRFMLLAVAAVLGAPGLSGLAHAYVNYDYYEGTWDALPDFAALTPVQSGLMVRFDISGHAVEEGFAYRFRAILDIAVSGVYTFYTNSDDGSRLYIDGALVVDNDGLHGMQERPGSIALSAGPHNIRVTYFEKTGGNDLKVKFAGPNIDKQPIPDTMLRPVQPPHTWKACCPLPPDGAVCVDPQGVLMWTAPPLVGQPRYDLSIGADPNLTDATVVGGLTQGRCDPPLDLAAGTTYYWRVDVYDPNVGGTPASYTGDVWSMTTRYGLVAYYPFDVDPNDASGNGHGGAYVGARDPNIVADPLRGNVLQLNPGGQGDAQYVEVGSVGISGAAPRTIAGWARAATTAIPNWTNVFGFVPDGSTGNTYFDVERDGSGNFVLHVHGWEKPFCTADTAWHHFAATYDGMTMKWYLDGELVGSEDRDLATIDTFRIGTRASHKTYFPGYVDDVRIWDYALPAEAIGDLVLKADFDRDRDVDAADLRTFGDSWLATTVIPGTIRPPDALDDFEIYSAMWPLTVGWFKYLADNPATTYALTLLTGLTDTPYGGSQAMRFNYSFPADAGRDDWLTIGARFWGTPSSPLRDLARYDELRFRIRYGAQNTADVGLFVHAGNKPPGVAEHEALRIGPFSTLDDPADPNQWHEVVIDLRAENALLNWSPDSSHPYSGVDEIHYVNGILVSVVNTSADPRTGVLYLDDIRLVDYTPDCAGLPLTDMNADCMVGLDDFAVLAEEWLRRQ